MANSKKQAIITQKDFNLIARIVKANWWIPVTILPLFYFISVFYVYRLTSVYEISTQILLQNNDSYYKGNVVSDANFYGAGSYVDNSNEKRVFLSYDLLERAVTKLKDRLEVSYFIVGKVNTKEQFVGMKFKVEVSTLNPDLYEVPFDVGSRPFLYQLINLFNQEYLYFHIFFDRKKIKYCNNVK